MRVSSTLGPRGNHSPEGRLGGVEVLLSWRWSHRSGWLFLTYTCNCSWMVMEVKENVVVRVGQFTIDTGVQLGVTSEFWPHVHRGTLACCPPPQQRT